MIRASILAASALLALAGCAAEGEAPPKGAPATAPISGIHEVDGLAPEDVVLEAHTEDGIKSTVRLRRAEHLVTLRRGSARAVGLADASLAVPHRDAPGVPLVWETTSVATLETTRGVIHFDVDGRPHLRMADPPAPLGREDHHSHACRSQDDGAGGFTVICGVLGIPTGTLNVTGASPDELTSFFAAEGGTIARFDLPARPGSVDGRVLDYTEGRTGVFVRVESIWLPGEERPSLVVLVSEREQRVFSRHHILDMMSD